MSTVRNIMKKNTVHAVETMLAISEYKNKTIEEEMLKYPVLIEIL